MENNITEQTSKGKNHVIFDTLSIAQKLESAGCNKKQARAQAEIWRDFINNFATKSDMKALKTELKAFKTELKAFKAEMKAFKTEIKSDMKCLKEDLINFVKEQIQHSEEKLRKDITISSRNIVVYLTIVVSAIETISRFIS